MSNYLQNVAIKSVSFDLDDTGSATAVLTIEDGIVLVGWQLSHDPEITQIDRGGMQLWDKDDDSQISPAYVISLGYIPIAPRQILSADVPPAITGIWQFPVVRTVEIRIDRLEPVPTEAYLRIHLHYLTNAAASFEHVSAHLAAQGLALADGSFDAAAAAAGNLPLKDVRL